jgi:YVTN family beta-propeller protein
MHRPASARAGTVLATALAALVVVCMLTGIGAAALVPPGGHSSAAIAAPAAAPRSSSLVQRGADDAGSPGQINKVIAAIPIPGGPSSANIALDSANDLLYVPSNFTNLTIVNASTNTVSRIIDLGPYASPETPTYVAAVDHIYVPEINSSSGPDNVSVINGTTNDIIRNVSVGEFASPAPATYDPINEDLYVPDYGTDNITVLNTSSHKIVATIDVGPFPFTPAFDPADGDLYVPVTSPLSPPGNVSIISGSTNTIIANFTGFSMVPTLYGDENELTNAPVYDPSNHEVYVPQSSGDNLSVFKGTTLVENIAVGPAPGTPTVDPVNGDLYVPIDSSNLSNGSANDTIVIVDPETNAVIDSIIVGLFPITPTYDPVNGEMYVSGFEDGSVTAINTTTNQVVAVDTTGSSPWGSVFDPANDELYVDNYLGTNLTVIAAGLAPKVVTPDTYSITFNETGLPTGAWWMVTLNGSGLNESSSTITFTGFVNGTYPFSLDSWENPVHCQSDLISYVGNVTVRGQAARVPMPFNCTASGGGVVPPPSPGGGSSSGFLGLAGALATLVLLSVIGVIVIVVIVVVVVTAAGRRRPPPPQYPNYGQGPPPGWQPPPPGWQQPPYPPGPPGPPLPPT